MASLPRRHESIALALCATALLVIGCLSRDDLLSGAPCPCSAGFFCCPVTESCLPDGASCLRTLRVLEVRPGRGSVEGGETLQVLGEGFSSELRLELGEAPCTALEVLSESEARCQAPPGPAAGGVVAVVARQGDLQIILPEAYRYVRPGFIDGSTDLLRGTEFGDGAAVADLELDGQLDFILSRRGSDFVGLTVWTATAAGQIRERTLDAPVVPRHLGVVVADLFGSAFPEILLASEERDPPLVILTSDEGRTYRPAPVEPLLVGTLFPAPVDLDGDGILEVLACRRFDEVSEDPRILVLEWSGERWQRRPAEPNPFHPGFPCEMLTLGDFDRDGDPDVAACGGALSIYENRSGQLFDISGAFDFPPELSPRCVDLTWVDWDDDGDLDLAYTLEGQFALGAAQGAQTGTFLVRNETGPAGPAFAFASNLDLSSALPECRGVDPTWDGAALRYGARGSAWLDADADGDQDLFLPLPSLSCPVGPLLLVNRHRQGGPGFAAARVEVGSLLAGAAAVVAADFDRDRDLDLLIHGGSGAPRILWSQRADVAPARTLVVRPWLGDRLGWGATVELWEGDSMSGPPDQIQTLSPRHRLASPPAVAFFGLGGASGPVTVRARLGGRTIMTTVGPETTALDLSL